VPWKGKPDTAKIVKAMLIGGWLIVKQGKHYRAYCPCPESRKKTSVNGSPQNDGSHARRLLDFKSKCPDKHEHMR
jgi:hypothetical protein